MIKFYACVKIVKILLGPLRNLNEYLTYVMNFLWKEEIVSIETEQGELLKINGQYVLNLKNNFNFKSR